MLIFELNQIIHSYCPGTRAMTSCKEGNKAPNRNITPSTTASDFDSCGRFEKRFSTVWQCEVLLYSVMIVPGVVVGVVSEQWLVVLVP